MDGISKTPLIPKSLCDHTNLVFQIYFLDVCQAKLCGGGYGGLYSAFDRESGPVISWKLSGFASRLHGRHITTLKCILNLYFGRPDHEGCRT